MLKIVTMTPQQFSELVLSVPAKHRWAMEHLPISHLYLPEFRTVVVVDDECTLVKFPSDETPSLSRAAQVAWNG